MPSRGVSVVQDRALEAEADRLGIRAASYRAPIQRGQALGRTDRSPQIPASRPVQRKVAINKHRAYDGNEVIAQFNYVRAGNPGGGNHFFPDKGVAEIVKEIATGQTRTAAYANLTRLATGLARGLVTPLGAPVDNVAYDQFIDQFIGHVSNAPANKFRSRGTGDGGGLFIDEPYQESDFKRVKKHAHKLLANIDAAYNQKGTGPTGLASTYVFQLRQFCVKNP